MGMNVGTEGAEDDVIMDVNTTPLIDVMLVLLVLFIMTIPIQLHAVNLDMPVPTNAPPPPVEPTIVTLLIDFDGTLYWNEAVVQKSELLPRMLEAAKGGNVAEQPEMHIKPHKMVDYGHVAHVMATAQKVGLKKLGMVGNEQYMN
jgi:biopolymer transport protein ExbD